MTEVELKNQTANFTSEKEKSTNLYTSIVELQDDNQKLKEDIAELNQQISNALEQINSRDSTLGQKDQTIELLQTKLKETSVTLQSNNSTIDSLKQSLAEAQKYSFRAILNNRQGAHHPNAELTKTETANIPVGYSGAFKLNHAQSLSSFLRQNDQREIRSRSNSPYRFTQCPNMTSNSKLQDSFMSKSPNNINPITIDV